MKLETRSYSCQGWYVQDEWIFSSSEPSGLITQMKLLIKDKMPNRKISIVNKLSESVEFFLDLFYISKKFCICLAARCWYMLIYNPIVASYSKKIGKNAKLHSLQKEIASSSNK